MAVPEAVMAEYLAESEEQLQRVNTNLGLIEKNEHTKATIDEMYRDMHTLKGSSLLFGFSFVGRVAHAMETSLDPLRKVENVQLSENQIDALFKCVDLIEKMLKDIQSGVEANYDQEMASVIPNLIQSSLQELGLDHALIPDKPGIGEDLSASKPAEPAKVASAPEAPVAEKAAPPAPKKAEVSPAKKEVPVSNENEKAMPKTGEKSGGGETSTVRVPVSLLDKLMTLMGEMVLVRNQVLQYANRSNDLEYHNLSKRLDVVTSELQGEVMKTRMQPIGNVVNKFQRLVRDLGKNLKKKIRLELKGTETELDKTLLEAIKDPLTHIVRNSCDHGVENPEDRAAAGKSEQGTVTISSYHESGHVLIEIIDDGRGLDPEKIGAKAIERGLVTQEKLRNLGDRQILDFIFMPGFSTAAQVTDVSGRGVGMDVVRTNIEKIGGMVDIQSKVGRGTTFKLKIPLTLAIVPAMVIHNDQGQFAIPQVKLVELLRVEEDDEVQIEYLEGKPVYRRRGHLLPLVDLSEVLKTGDLLKDVTPEVPEPKVEEKKEAGDDDVPRVGKGKNIVVLNADVKHFGLIVEEIEDTAEVVVKPLSQFLKGLGVYAGATVMGDGSVALILDVMGLAQKGHVFSETTVGVDDNKMDEVDGRFRHRDAQEFLMCRINTNGKYAFPLNLVHRLEEFSSDKIEITGEQRVVRYRGTILPLISLNGVLGFEDPEEVPPKLSVIVVRRSEHLYGIVVQDILDVVSVNHDIDDTVKDRHGILGNLALEDEVVVVVDVLGILNREIQRLGGEPKVISGGKDDAAPAVDVLQGDPRRSKFTILLAEDTAFFRKIVEKALTDAGFEVVCADDGAEALELLESGTQSVDLLLSDIEMPRMNGFELVQSVRGLEKWKTLPAVALTTRFSDRHRKKGIEVGFNEYLEKLKVDILIQTVDALLKVKEMPNDAPIEGRV